MFNPSVFPYMGSHFVLVCSLKGEQPSYILDSIHFQHRRHVNHITDDKPHRNKPQRTSPVRDVIESNENLDLGPGSDAAVTVVD